MSRTLDEVVDKHMEALTWRLGAIPSPRHARAIFEKSFTGLPAHELEIVYDCADERCQRYLAEKMSADL